MWKQACSLLFLALFILPFSARAAEKKAELKLEDLGFTKAETKQDLDTQRILETRTSKLKTHQALGLVTLGLMTATVLTAEENKVPPAHKTLGIITGLSYFTTAYFALSAPDAPTEQETRGTNIKIHKALAWIHFPAMVLTPIAGFMAAHQIDKGEKPHGLAAQKVTIATIAYASFVPAALSMFFEF